ncbi:hypothetical protein [Maridesulfovibrio ferrireducens]|uniref:hypothetical protein n=1 Tax=Maridesulfovibrio ferrireducens TaxID=246191 RepID=UPI001A2AD83B|nr:hypothetical protein [Maridesulfovibrio ferrireducens]MBI9109949.1 hypothetical protein [Maridesulfovibrio ferrireducens]
MSKKIVGCSAFGLRDVHYINPENLSGEEYFFEDFYLADALLPRKNSQKIRVGKSAELERFQAGLTWPLEAQVSPESYLQRVPIPFAWDVLVQAEDRRIRWESSKSASFSVESIIAAHVHNLVSPEDNLVLAIPDHLDELGQTGILKELQNLNHRDPKLIWRAVAATLSWKEKLDLSKLCNRKKHIIVIYIGADGIEFTPIEMFDYTPKDQKTSYCIPKRRRPEKRIPWTGMDWATSALQNIYHLEDNNAFWQSFTTANEIWSTLANNDFLPIHSPKVWHDGKKWKRWENNQVSQTELLKLKVETASKLYNLSSKSCKLRASTFKVDCNWGDYLQNEFKDVLKTSRKDSKLLSVIFCGSLVSENIPQWFLSLIPELEKLGVSAHGDLHEQEVGKIWIPKIQEDPIAEGAFLYGDYLQDNLPTYLDELPRLSLKTQKDGQPNWMKLVQKDEILGGEEYVEKIPKIVSIKKGYSSLKCQLLRGKKEKKEILDPDKFPKSKNISPAKAALIRDLVNKSTTKNFSWFTRIEEDYASEYKNFITLNETGKLLEQQDSPVREVVFDFPGKASQNIPVRIEVKMKPANGLAQVEIIPENIDGRSYFGNTRAFLDYSKMNSIALGGYGYPPLQDILIDPSDEYLNENSYILQNVLITKVEEEGYDKKVNSLRTFLSSRSYQTQFMAKEFRTRIIDQNGNPATNEGQKLINKLVQKIDLDMQMDVHDEKKFRDTLFVRGSWLWGQTPQSVLSYIRKILQGQPEGNIFNYALDAAGRSFKKKDDLQLLFNAVLKKNEQEYFSPQKKYDGIKINGARACYYALMYSPEATPALSINTAKKIAESALLRLKRIGEGAGYDKLFFQLILLLLFLLRVKKHSETCFYKMDEIYTGVLIQIEEAEKYFSKKRDLAKKNKVSDVKKLIQGFLDNQGSLSDVSGLVEAAED